jgi:pyruvate kinase
LAVIAETREDLDEVKELLAIRGRNIKIVAKIQTQKALINFEQILENCDGILIARGHLCLSCLEDVL